MNDALKVDSVVYDLKWLFENEVASSPAAEEILRKSGMYDFFVDKFSENVLQNLPLNKLYEKLSPERRTEFFNLLLKSGAYSEFELKKYVKNISILDDENISKEMDTKDSYDLIEELEIRCAGEAGSYSDMMNAPEAFLANYSELQYFYHNKNLEEFLITFGRTYPQFKYIVDLLPRKT